MRPLFLVRVMLAVAIGIASAPAHAQIPTEGSVVGSASALSDYFGAAVALSGEAAIVGAPLNDVGGVVNRGAAHVFRRVEGVWFEEATLVGTDSGPGDQFGASVAIDGDIAVVGAPFVDLRKTDEGAAYVFIRTQGAWVPSGKLTATDSTAGANFGSAVAVYGNTVLVGAPNQKVDGHAGRGAVYVFDLTTGTQTKVVSDNGAAGDHFGQSVSLHGTTAIIGAPGNDVAGRIDQGAAYMFDLTPGNPAQLIAQLTSNDADAGDLFGHSVSLHGTIAVIGAPGNDVAGRVEQGAAYVFDLAPGTQGQIAQLTAPVGAAGDKFGWSVGVSGNAILVGAYGAGGSRGSAYLFDTPPWSNSRVFSGGTPNSYTGWAVALSGTILTVGAPVAQSLGRVDFFDSTIPAAVGDAASIDLTPSSETPDVYTSQTVTATVRDASQQPVAGALVVFGGPGVDARCYTRASGSCGITIGGPAFPRVDTMQACTSFPAAICDTASIIWIFPGSTAGSSDGSGAIMPLGSVGSEVSFSFKADPNRGKCQVKDQTTGVTVQCLDVFRYVQSGPHAFFYGTALVNGVVQLYRVDVNDGGQSRDAIDTFTLVTDNGVTVVGAAVKGNLQVQ